MPCALGVLAVVIGVIAGAAHCATCGITIEALFATNLPPGVVLRMANASGNNKRKKRQGNQRSGHVFHGNPPKLGLDRRRSWPRKCDRSSDGGTDHRSHPFHRIRCRPTSVSSQASCENVIRQLRAWCACPLAACGIARRLAETDSSPEHESHSNCHNSLRRAWHRNREKGRRT